MKDLSSDNQADVIKAFNSMSRYLDDLRLFLTALFHPKFMINVMTLILI